MGDSVKKLFWVDTPSRDNPNDPKSIPYQEKKAEDLRQEIILRNKNQEGAQAATATAKAARDRQRRIALANEGRSSTIQSGPQGLQDPSNDFRKTLLGQ